MVFGKSRSIVGRIVVVLLSVVAVTAVGAGIPWAGAKIGLWDWPKPSAWYGVLLGFLGGAIVLFEMALYPRKSFRRFKLGRMKMWMWLHVWLGIVCLPVIVVHAGFGFGGPLPAATLILFLAVIASGVWGLVLQQWLPEKILRETPDETIASQSDRAARFYLGRRLRAAKMGEGDRTGEVYRLIEALIEPPPEPDELVMPVKLAIGVGAGPAVYGRGSGETAPQAEPLVTGQPARDLVAFRDLVLVPYLLDGRRSGSPLSAATESTRRFARLRETVRADARPVIDRLEELADLRRLWDRQAWVHWWLHNWIPVHLFLSVAMTGLMLVHAVRALKYW